jgi:carboxymethylenebutenolidase
MRVRTRYVWMAACLLAAATTTTLRAQAPAAPQRNEAIAPGAEHVADVLAKSTGKWMTSKMADGTTLKMWVVMPASTTGKTGTVLVIHENMGLNDWARAVADQLGRQGFIAIAVDALSGKAPDGGGTAELGSAVRQAYTSLTPADVVARLDAAWAFAKAMPNSNGKYGVVGFCWGGGQSFNYAIAQPNVNAAIVYYGSTPSNMDTLASITAPVLGLYGGNDGRITTNVEPTAARMKELGKSFTYHIYEGAGHGFLRQQNNEPNLKAAQQAWPATLAFFREHLR